MCSLVMFFCSIFPPLKMNYPSVLIKALVHSNDRRHLLPAWCLVETLQQSMKRSFQFAQTEFPLRMQKWPIRF